MKRNSLLVCLMGILACFLTGIVAVEAIIGGRVLRNIDSVPYQVYFRNDFIETSNDGIACGGSIVDNLNVLTAAHCILKADGQLINRNVAILAGEVKTLTSTVSMKIRVRVTRFFVPREYEPHNPLSLGDIALLRLSAPLNLQDHNLGTVDLTRNLSMSYPQTNVRIAGYGWHSFTERPRHRFNAPSNLKSAEANVLSHDECQHIHPNRRITEKHLCARVFQIYHHGNHLPGGACVGDEGGALVDSISIPNQRIVLGVLSKIGTNCSELNSSGIYTRATSYFQFISDALDNRITPDMLVFDR